MAEVHEIECWGHNSIYLSNYLKGNYKKRKFKCYFSIPESGVNNDTGIVLLIAGFGGHANSNIYIKMRNDLADKYNLVTIQCDYFGWEFMQSDIGAHTLKYLDIEKLKESISQEAFESVFKSGYFELNELVNIAPKKKINVDIEKVLAENLSNFNDMGIMQAIDNITAVLVVMSLLYDNNFKFNTKKVMIMGNSQGSYLSYLCNVLCDGLFSYILDNSAWTYPVYLNESRNVNFENNNLYVNVVYDYLAKKHNLNYDYLDIRNMYSDFDNKCKIVIYHGEDDKLISLEDKMKAVDNISNKIFNLITEKDIDRKVFKGSGHGLGANFLELFDKFYNDYVEDDKSELLDFENKNLLKGENKSLEVNYSRGMPVVYFDKK